MAQPSATAVFLLLLLSLHAVAHCRTLESEPATDASTATVADETGPPNLTVIPAPAAVATEVVPAEQDGFLRLPSHRLHRHHPCRPGLFHRHLWWARHHGLDRDGHRFHRRGDVEIVSVDGEPSRGSEAEEVKPVAEPDPDRSLPDSDGEDSGDDAAAVKQWRKEMLWRMFRHSLRHHRHHEDVDEEDHAQEEKGTSAGVKRFRHHDDDEEEDEEKDKKMRKLFHLHHRHHDEDEEEKMRKPFHHDDDGDDEDDGLEEMVRRFRKAILRRRFHHGRRFFRHHHHGRRHHAEEANEQSDGEQQREDGGVMTWIKGLMNRF